MTTVVTTVERSGAERVGSRGEGMSPATTAPMRRITQSRKLHQVRYDVRGPILVEAQRLEAEGHKILKLNIGNPAPFGFEAPAGRCCRT